MIKGSLRQILILAATIITLAVNFLSNALPINNITTAEISDSYPVFFVPAGYVFAIWGLIYIALIAFSVYQLLPAQKESSILNKLAVPYIISSAANSIWLFLCWIW